MALYAVKDLTFFYPDTAKPALDKVSFEIREGEYVCLCGTSGSGKSTLLRHFKSVLTPHGTTEGRITFDGQPLSYISQREQAMRIGVVMQDPDAQLVTDTVAQELAFGLENLGCAPEQMRLRVAEMANYFGVESLFHSKIAQLSGGQKQLVNLASIMAMHPDVLVLDEPTSQLDPIAADELLNAVRKINRDLGITVVIAEQRLEEVYAQADTVIVMDDGCVIAVGSPQQVAQQLFAEKRNMTLALPSPIRVFYGVQPVVRASEREKGQETAEDVQACPLTIRQGRSWLDEQVNAYPPSQYSLPEADLSPIQGQPALRLSGMRVRYKRDANDVLRGLDLMVFQGQVVAVMGGNGSGKSTLLKSICGLVRPYSGTVEILGRRAKQWDEQALFRGVLGMLPQDPTELFCRETVADELHEMLFDNDVDEFKRRLVHVQEFCDLRGLLAQHPFDLSGGEQQRVALAKVLLAHPKVLLLDEPTKGLDAGFRREFIAMVHTIAAQGVAVIIVSHDVEFCARCADTVALLFDGKIVSMAPPRSFFAANSFYTTAANRMCRQVFANAVTDEEVISLCLSAPSLRETGSHGEQ